ncbi:unnamed protein product [Parnassius apollo]|uniref:(apollo) hypothetical protein n=1 Tax=Parnassius apollo TaxID=110799 RepID=A0A8S3W610_PARAO|nr:unnamed protein product [Parnassius apollo]
MLWVSGLIFIIFCGTTSGYIVKDECPPDEEYLTCGSACPLNCTNQEPVACTKNCVAGCFCKPNYLRNKNGTCVRPEECFAETYPVCGENEEYTTCGSACPLTCSQYEPRTCILVCIEGCFCKPGYYRNEITGKCVTLDQCPVAEDYQVCGENEEYTTCGSACPPTCALPEPGVCTLDCRVGCFCKSGYYRDEITGKCVTLDQCSVVCGENEEYNSCGSACPRMCNKPAPEACIQVCRAGCFCKPGYCRDESTGKCIEQSKCADNRCPKNEVYSTCNARCQPSCNNTNPVCPEICVPGCVCAPGLVRNDCGECVSVDKCFENGSYESFMYNYLNNLIRLYQSYYA